MKDWILNERIDRVLLRLAIPAVVASLSELLLNLGDTFWVSFLGDRSVAALGAGSYIIWIIFSLIDIAESSIISIISQKIGSGRREEANTIFARLSVFFLLLFSLMVIPGIFLSRAGLLMTGVEEVVFEKAFLYVSITLVFLPSMLIFYAISAATQAYGDTRSPMEATILTVLLNLAIDPIFILVLKLDLAGLALASGLSRILGTVYVWRRFKRTSGFEIGILRREWRKVDLKLGVKALNIGFPVSLGGISFSLIYFYILKIVAEFGTNAVAAMAVGNRIEGITYLFGVGYYTAVATVVGQSMGAGKTERAKQAVKRAFLHTGVFAVLMGTLFFFTPDLFGRPFLNEELSLEILRNYLRINAFSQLPMIYHVVLEGAFVGTGYTLPNFFIPIPFWLLRIPLSLYLAFQTPLGVNGVWASMFITQSISTVLLYVWWVRFIKNQ